MIEHNEQKKEENPCIIKHVHNTCSVTEMNVDYYSTNKEGRLHFVFEKKLFVWTPLRRVRYPGESVLRF